MNNDALYGGTDFYWYDGDPWQDAKLLIAVGLHNQPFRPRTLEHILRMIGITMTGSLELSLRPLEDCPCSTPSSAIYHRQLSMRLQRLRHLTKSLLIDVAKGTLGCGGHSRNFCKCSKGLWRRRKMPIMDDPMLTFAEQTKHSQNGSREW